MVNFDWQLFSRIRFVQRDGIDLGIEAVIMRSKRIQDLPDNLETGVVIECLRWRNVRSDCDRKNNVPVVLALRLAHDAADGLDNVDHGITRVEEDDGVQRWDIDTLRQTPGVCEHASVLLGCWRLQPRKLRASL